MPVRGPDSVAGPARGTAHRFIAQATGPIGYRDWSDVLHHVPGGDSAVVEELRHAYRVPAEIMALALPLLIYVLLSAEYRLRRVLTFLDPWSEPTSSGFQVIQSLIAFGSGQLWGRGLGESRQKLFYLPEAHTDFVYSVIGEELGLLGAMVVLALFGIIIARGFRLTADHVGSRDLKDFFSDTARQRERFAAELLPYAQRLGGGQDAEGTALGAVHRGWMKVKDAISNYDEDAVIVEAIRGEGAAANTYAEAVMGVLPPDARPIIDRQYEQIRNAQRELDQLRLARLVG